MVEHLPSVHEVLGFLLSPNPYTLFLLSTGSMESNCVRGWAHLRLSPPLRDGGSLWTALSHRQSRGFSSEACRDRFRNLLGLPLHPSLALFPLAQLT